MTARGRGRHEVIQGGRWIVGSYEQDQFLLDGTHVLTWQLHWVAGWSPADGEYRATVADVYGHAEVMRGRIDGDRLVFESVETRPRGSGSPGSSPDRRSLAQRDGGRRRTMVAGGGVPLHPREERRTLRRPTVGRFPRWVFGAGDEPDARFTLANERTFLAWIRTSLALSAAGVALVAVELPVPRGFRTASALVLVGPGVLAPVLAWFRWAALERGIRLTRPSHSSVRCWPWASPWRRCSVLVGLLVG